MKPKKSEAMVRFVESEFEDGKTTGEIARHFPGAANVSVKAMSLREIFVAMAGGGRER